MGAVEARFEVTFDEGDPRATPLENLAYEGHEKRLDLPPLNISRDRIREDGSQGVAVTAIHVSMISEIDITRGVSF